MRALWMIAPISLMAAIIPNHATAEGESGHGRLIQHDLFNSDGRFAGTYLCIEEASGGLHYDKSSREWSSTRLNVNTTPLTVVVKDEKLHVDQYDDEQHFHTRYTITVGRVGDRSDACELKGEHSFETLREGTVAILDETGLSSCTTFGGNYRFDFNFNDLRFAHSATMGYVRPWSHGDDSPVVTGGRCSKVD